MTSNNIEEEIQKCRELYENSDWDSLIPIFISIRNLISNSSPNENFNSLVTEIIKNLSASLNLTSDLNQYEVYLNELALILPTKKDLWDFLHQDHPSKLRLTLNQVQELFSKFFSPEMLFEFGFQNFTSIEICENRNFQSEEGLIDIFYATVGFLRSCNLSEFFQATHQIYLNFIQSILQSFLNLPDMDAHRFVWLVENIQKYCRVAATPLKKICENVIESYIEKDENPRTKLFKLCTISTSPFLNQLPVISKSINTLNGLVVQEANIFVRKFILSGLVIINWKTRSTTISDSIRCWKLFLLNDDIRCKENLELPSSIRSNVIDNSLIIFNEYYKIVQPYKETSVVLRSDIFTIIDCVEEFYPNNVPYASLERCWNMLLIAAVTGAFSSDFVFNLNPSWMDTPRIF
jgi:hypothetical protein